MLLRLPEDLLDEIDVCVETPPRPKRWVFGGMDPVNGTDQVRIQIGVILEASDLRQVIKFLTSEGDLNEQALEMIFAYFDDTVYPLRSMSQRVAETCPTRTTGPLQGYHIYNSSVIRNIVKETYFDRPDLLIQDFHAEFPDNGTGAPFFMEDTPLLSYFPNHTNYENAMKVKCL
ncbi:unnamed protein product [Sphagnum jensenii]|uniref:Uncharacterized protein n=2 Tax=Sphagnum jensenii TaxID=128206 RepID=A0ABP0VJ33_9BRYO